MAWYDINNYISPETINEIAREHWVETCLRPIIYFITDPVLKWLLDSWDPHSLLSAVAFVVAFSAFFVLLVVGLVQLGYCWYVVNRWLSDWTVKFLREKLHFFLYRPKAFPLMRLPPELRLKIYEYLLPEDRMFHLTAGIPEATWKTHSSTQGVFRSRFPALLYVSRQVHREFQPLFYGSSTFVITIDRPKELFSALKMIEQLLPPNSINQVDVFTMMRDLRLRVDTRALVDVSGPAARMAMYGKSTCNSHVGSLRGEHKRVVVTDHTYGYLQHMYKGKEETERTLDELVKQAKVNKEGSNVDCRLIREMIDAVFEEWSLHQENGFKEKLLDWTPWKFFRQ
ncbi:hypothetical protein D6C77_03650 [Aureobasidium pullulans]|nr:hypothetical protein D6C77_03650 [Aureobasidium pullulans]